MLIGRLTTYYSVKQRQKSAGELSPKHVPLSSEFMSSKNLINERPLKSISNILSRLPNDINIGLRVYGHKNSFNPITSCTASELLVSPKQNAQQRKGLVI